MIGTPFLQIGLDADQGIGTSTLDGRQFVVLTATDAYSASTLGLPMDGAILLAAEYSYGRDRFIVGDFQTGLCTIVLNNNNGEWSPGSGVNTFGGDKIQPGMLVQLGYQISTSAAESYVEAQTGNSWGSSTYTDAIDRAVVDSETATGHVDARTWTAHVATPGDIDLVVPVQDSTRSVLGFQDAWSCFAGRILRVEDRYDPGGRGAVTVLTVVDYMADLSQYNPGALVSPRSAEDTDDRWLYIWTQAINDGNMVASADTGLYDVESTDLPANYLEEARVAARAEGGAIYADHKQQGKLLFKAANWLVEDPRSATTQATIGDTRIGIISATTDYSLTRLFNDLYYTNSSTTVNVSDATSIADYSTRTLRKTILNNDNTDLDTIADRDLALLKDAKLVITSVELRPQNLWEELFCAAVAVGDLLDVIVENRGWSYRQNLHVSGVSQSWNAATGEWVCTLRLDSRDGDTVIS